MMKPSRITNEWLMGATVGAYLVLSFVLTFWGSAFLHSYCANTSYGFMGANGVLLSNLAFLVPGAVAGVLDWLQLRLLQADEKLVSARAVRVALWMNFLGAASLLLVVSDNFGPDWGASFPWVLAVVGIAFLPLGVLLSIGNVVAGYAQKIRDNQKLKSPSSPN
jgi:hypothetical protein